MTLWDWITNPHTDLLLTPLWLILMRGWALLIVSLVLFCYLAFRRRASLGPSAIVSIVANSLGKSSVTLLIAIMILNYADALQGHWSFFILVPFFAPHLTIGALILPLSIFFGVDVRSCK